MDELNLLASDRRDPQLPTGSEQLYFEVLVVESMTEEQERALRKEVRGGEYALHRQRLHRCRDVSTLGQYQHPSRTPRSKGSQ